MQAFIIVTCCILLGICIYHLQIRKKAKNAVIVPEIEPEPISGDLPIANKNDNTYLPSLINRVYRLERSMWDRYQANDPEMMPLRIYLEQLHARMESLEIFEGFVANRTSYSIGKQRIILCMRSKEPENWSELIDENIVMFALLHELGHISCPCVDHPPEFTHVFRSLLYQAIRYGIWKPTDYEKIPARYCGKTVAAVPLTAQEMQEAASKPLVLKE